MGDIIVLVASAFYALYSVLVQKFFQKQNHNAAVADGNTAPLEEMNSEGISNDIHSTSRQDDNNMVENSTITKLEIVTENDRQDTNSQFLLNDENFSQEKHVPNHPHRNIISSKTGENIKYPSLHTLLWISIFGFCTLLPFSFFDCPNKQELGYPKSKLATPRRPMTMILTG